MTHVHIRAQHAAGRTEPLNRLLAQLPPAVEVVTDDGPPPANPWRGYQKCLSGIPACSHLLVIQDDATVCENFMEAVSLIAAANPDTPVCLFVPGAARRAVMLMTQALRQGRAYIELPAHTFVPVVAVLWPRHKAESFLQWALANPKRLGHEHPRSDDAVAARWARFSGERVLATVPSLVEHDDTFASSIGLRARAGLDKGRVAAYFIGSGDALSIGW